MSWWIVLLVSILFPRNVTYSLNKQLVLVSLSSLSRIQTVNNEMYWQYIVFNIYRGCCSEHILHKISGAGSMFQFIWMLATAVPILSCYYIKPREHLTKVFPLIQ